MRSLTVPSFARVIYTVINKFFETQSFSFLTESDITQFCSDIMSSSLGKKKETNCALLIVN